MLPTFAKGNDVHTAQEHKDRAVVSRDEWLRKRKELLETEKNLTRATDAWVKRLRELPWQAVEKEYVFEGEKGPVSLRQLFGDKEDLIVYHMMWAPADELPCPSCSMWVDGLNGQLHHITERAALAVVARAPAAALRRVGAHKGWRLPLVSSGGCSFNADFDVLNSADNMARGVVPPGYNGGAAHFWPTEDWPGISVFHRAANGSLCRTYSCHARGLEYVNTGYKILDFLPFGRESFSPKHHKTE